MKNQDEDILICPICHNTLLNLSANMMCETKGCMMENKIMLRGEWNELAKENHSTNQE